MKTYITCIYLLMWIQNKILYIVFYEDYNFIWIKKKW